MLRRVYKELAACESVLDLGTGHGAIAGKIARIGGPKRIVGIDAHKPSVGVATKKFPKVEFLCHDVRSLDEIFRPRSFKAVVGFDILEHLKKTETYSLLTIAELLATELVWWFVPIGEHPQTFDPRKEGNATLQRHRSVWRAEEFVQLGYDVWYYPDWHSGGSKYNATGKSTEAAFCRKVSDSLRPGRLTTKRRYPRTANPS